MAETLYPDQHIHVTKSGDDWAIHRCQIVLLKNMRVIPSLKLDYPDMPIPTVYRNLQSQLRDEEPHSSDLCYASPIVKSLKQGTRRHLYAGVGQR